MQARTPAPARDHEMRQPGPVLPAIDAEPLQPLLDVPREQRSPSPVVLEDEHADAPRLAVAHRREPDLPRSRGGLTQNADDRFELAGGPVTEERQRDVQVRAGHDAAAGQMLALPGLDGVEDVVRKAQR